MKKNKPSFHSLFIVQVTNHPGLYVAADTFGECALKAHKFINSLETRESHEIISITRNVNDVLL